MSYVLRCAAAAAAMLALTACENLPYSKQTQGAAIGAAAGGAAGHVLTDSTIGTIGGAAVGGVVGSEVGRRQDERR